MDIYSTANQMKLERKTIFDMPMRVTFYARVLTTREEQENSIENQIAFFTDMIQKKRIGRISRAILTACAANLRKTVRASCA